MRNKWKSKARQIDDATKHAMIEHFADNVLNPENWFAAANSLELTLKHLSQEVAEWSELTRNNPSGFDGPKAGVARVFLMLAGVAIENLCKGLLVSRLTLEERDLVRLAGKLPSKLQKHLSISLFDAIEFPLTPGQECLVEILGKAVVWRGRYSAPTDWSGLTPSFDSTSNPQNASRLLRDVRMFVRRAMKQNQLGLAQP